MSYMLGPFLDRQGDMAAIRGIFNRVGQQIQKDLVYPQLIHHHMLMFDPFAVNLKCMALGFHLRPDDRINVFD